MEINSRQTVIIAILVLFLGRYLHNKISIFHRYNIPEPVIGGVIASIFFGGFYFLFDISLNFSLEQRDALLVVFFTCVGLSAKFSTLLQGGKTLVILLVLSVVFLCLQNFTGISIAMLTGLSAETGVLGGSVSLSGGHGTTIAWAPIFAEQYGIANAVEIGIACATFGLVFGGIMGGPVFNYLIKKYNLSSTSTESLSVSVPVLEQKKPTITVNSVYNVLLILSIAIGIGLSMHQAITEFGMKLPVFVPCLFGGIILTNTVPLIWKNINWPTGTPTLALVSDFCLGLFLSMSLMSLQLWTLIDLALPIVLLLLAQVFVISMFVILVVFRVLGKTYDAAVISAGYVGLGLGATPTAIANMTAVTKQHGASPQAFIVVPLIGAFFIDIINAVIIQLTLNGLG